MCLLQFTETYPLRPNSGNSVINMILIIGFVWQQMVMKMLQDLTNLLADISANGIATDVPYLLIAEKNLVYGVGKQLQASSTGGGGEGESDNVNIAVSDGR